MAIFSVFSAIGSWFARAGISAAISSASASAVTSFVFGGIATAASALATKIALSFSNKGIAASPTYQGIKYTQLNSNLPLPVIYGTVQTAGNILWQKNEDDYSQKIIAFSEGEITGFSDIKINDIALSSIQGAAAQQFYGTESQLLPDFIKGNSYLEKVAEVGSLKNVAYLALTVFNNEKIGSSYNLTAVVQGKKIRVYSSPNVYTVKYSENPAWVLFDFLTSYNGLGLALNDNSEVDEILIAKLFDINSFLEAASYCDELVAGSPRFTFNMIFDAQTSARTLLDEIYRSCRGGLFFKNGVLQFKIDKAEPISKVFTEEDISNEVFNSVPSEEHYDIVKCVYISPQHEWQKVEAFAEIPEYRSGVPVENTVEIFSCTNFQQASRLAWYYANCKTLQPYYGSFDTDFRAYDLEVGDVIRFSSILMGLNNYTVKVTQITDDNDGTFRVFWQTYDERLYQDTLGSLEPRVLVTKLNDLYTCPPDVTGFNVVQSGRMFNFVWNSLNNVTYEIREGTLWSSAKVVATKITDNFYSCEIDSTGLHTFLIKVFNKYNYSENPASDTIFVDYIPEKNIVIEQNILDCNGAFNKTTLYQGVLKLLPENLFWQNLAGVWNDVEVDTCSIQGRWGVKTYESGDFTSEIFDLGRSFKNISSVEFNAVGEYEILFRFADDLTTLSQRDFIPFVKNEYTYRFYQFKIVLTTKTTPISYIYDVKFYIDVPDKTASYSIEVTDANNGYLLNYEEVGFYSVPGIVATVTDSISAYACTANKTPTFAIIYAVSNSGSKTTAKIDVQLFGY